MEPTPRLLSPSQLAIALRRADIHAELFGRTLLRYLAQADAMIADGLIVIDTKERA